jgi:hypothetical protein
MEQELLDRIQQLENTNHELVDRCDLLGRQITQMKEIYEKLIIEINILKEGGNL